MSAAMAISPMVRVVWLRTRIILRRLCVLETGGGGGGGNYWHGGAGCVLEINLEVLYTSQI